MDAWLYRKGYINKDPKLPRVLESNLKKRKTTNPTSIIFLITKFYIVLLHDKCY